MRKSENPKPKTLILGIGNILMGDEGVGVRVVEELKKNNLPENVELLDGGTGGFILLEPMRNAEKIILIDAAIDENEVGTIKILRPRFSKDYPKTLTAHDIGLKDLLDAFYLLGETPDVTLFAITISKLNDLEIKLSPKVEETVSKAVEMIFEEIRTLKNN